MSLCKVLYKSYLPEESIIALARADSEEQTNRARESPISRPGKMYLLEQKRVLIALERIRAIQSSCNADTLKIFVLESARAVHSVTSLFISLEDQPVAFFVLERAWRQTPTKIGHHVVGYVDRPITIGAILRITAYPAQYCVFLSPTRRLSRCC